MFQRFIFAFLGFRLFAKMASSSSEEDDSMRSTKSPEMFDDASIRTNSTLGRAQSDNDTDNSEADIEVVAEEEGMYKF